MIMEFLSCASAHQNPLHDAHPEPLWRADCQQGCHRCSSLKNLKRERFPVGHWRAHRESKGRATSVAACGAYSNLAGALVLWLAKNRLTGSLLDQARPDFFLFPLIPETALVPIGPGLLSRFTPSHLALQQSHLAQAPHPTLTDWLTAAAAAE